MRVEREWGCWCTVLTCHHEGESTLVLAVLVLKLARELAGVHGVTLLDLQRVYSRLLIVFHLQQGRAG